MNLSNTSGGGSRRRISTHKFLANEIACVNTLSVHCRRILITRKIMRRETQRENNLASPSTVTSPVQKVPWFQPAFIHAIQKAGRSPAPLRHRSRSNYSYPITKIARSGENSNNPRFAVRREETTTRTRIKDSVSARSFSVSRLIFIPTFIGMQHDFARYFGISGQRIFRRDAVPVKIDARARVERAAMFHFRGGYLASKVFFVLGVGAGAGILSFA